MIYAVLQMKTFSHEVCFSYRKLKFINIKWKMPQRLAFCNKVSNLEPRLLERFSMTFRRTDAGKKIIVTRNGLYCFALVTDSRKKFHTKDLIAQSIFSLTLARSRKMDEWRWVNYREKQVQGWVGIGIDTENSPDLFLLPSRLQLVSSASKQSTFADSWRKY